MRGKQALTTGDVAKYCGVSFRTVIRWIEGGRLKAYRLPGRGDNRIHVDEFLRFLGEHDMPVPEELTDSQRRVLVVDSDPVLADEIARTLSEKGFETETASNGFEVGCALEHFSPAVMTLDLNVSGLSGEDLLAYIRSQQDHKQTKILILSADSIDRLEGILASGADDFLQKPYTPSLLVEKVAELADATDRVRGLGSSHSLR